jgi:Tachylectin
LFTDGENTMRSLSRLMMLPLLILALWQALPSTASATDFPLFGDTSHGTYGRAECPKGSYLVGFEGRSGGWIDQLMLHCAKQTADSKTVQGYTTVRPIGTSQGGVPRDKGFYWCRPGNLLRWVEFEMSYGDDGRAKYLGYIHGQCEDLQTSDQTLRPFFGNSGSTVSSDPMITALHGCVGDEFATGLHFKAGEFIHAVGLICGPYPLMPERPSTAPTVLISAGAQLMKGRDTLRMIPSPRLTGTHVAIEMQWVAPFAGSKYFVQPNPALLAYEVATEGLTSPSGLPLPDGLRHGQWQVRMRISRPSVSDWSSWIPFSYVEPVKPLGKSQTPPAPIQQVTLYGVQPNGQVTWYRHTKAATGEQLVERRQGGNESGVAWEGPVNTVTLVKNYKQIVSGGFNYFYGLTQDGRLDWFMHADIGTGGPNWPGPREVATGWGAFRLIFSAGGGRLYAVTADGTLLWFPHRDLKNGTPIPPTPKKVGNGWQLATKVVGACNGVMYVLMADGQLRWYHHVGWLDGTQQWEPHSVVGQNWQQYRDIVAGCDGILYTLANDRQGTLLWHKHLGFKDGKNLWDGPKPVGTGWQGFSRIVAAKYGQ